jgi:chitinase
MVSYDCPEAVTNKIEYIKSSKLGGAMWWEMSGDRPKNGSSGESSISLAYKSLRGKDGKDMEKSDNCLNYPMSKYDNMRQEMPEQ